jgi:predicted AAA+ superfamily ATPase
VLLDEWQVVPEVLGAIKRAVDTDSRSGRFLLTGSVRADLDAPTWPGTGRLVRVPMYGMTVAEQRGQAKVTPFLDRLVQDEPISIPKDAPDLRGYLELCLQSGFPEAALVLSAKTRARWIESYLEQLLTRDATHMEGIRDPSRLRRFFEAYALNSAGIATEKTLYDAAGLDRRTAIAYEHLLSNLMVIDQVPAWTANRLKRLARAPKRYLVDPALLAGILRVDAEAILRDGDLLGRVLDTFVAAQLRAELAFTDTRPRLYHLRQEQGRHEVDLLAEVSALRVIGIEVKASAAPRTDAAAHLIWLREALGSRFVRGVVFHTGPRAYPLEERILALPICALWGD